MNSDSQLSVQLAAHWQGLLADTSGDEFTVGGQSVRELERLEAFEAFLATCPSEPIPTFHHFSEGVYMREIRAPKDAVLIGHEHVHECMNLMLAGRVLTITNGEISEFVAPCVVKSGARTRKASIVVEDMIWITVHPNPDNQRDIAKLEERFLIKSPTFIQHQSDHEQPRAI
jgi:hypothetical protein